MIYITHDIHKFLQIKTLNAIKLVRPSFLTLAIWFIFVNPSAAQINKAKYYKTILKKPIDSFLVREAKGIGAKLILKPDQVKKLQSETILYYMAALRRIHNKKEAHSINTLRRNVEWNFSEYQYLKNLKKFLTEEQKKIFIKSLPSKKR